MEEQLSKKKSNNVAAVIFILIAVVLPSFFILKYISSSSAQNGRENASPTVNSEPPSNQSKLISCIDSVSKWFDKNAPTNGQSLNLLPERKQQANECQTRYPVAASSGNQNGLQKCLDNVDVWWDKEATTVGEANTMLSVKEQFVSECQMMFPV